MSEHTSYEDNQGMCHNGCGRILNSDSARGYWGEKGYVTLLEGRVRELEAAFEEMEAGDPQGWAERNLQKIKAEDEIAAFLAYDDFWEEN